LGRLQAAGVVITCVGKDGKFHPKVHLRLTPPANTTVHLAVEAAA
jgi:hypothetical protein